MKVVGFKSESCGVQQLQVRRDKKTRVKEPGSAPSIEERQHWLTAVEAFCQPKEQNKRPRRSYTDLPRLASLDFIREIDNAMRHSLNRRQHDFQVDKAAILRKADEGSITAHDLMKLAPFISVTSDQASWQVCASHFMKWKGVNMVTLWDPAAHRIHNDWKLSVADAKLKSVILRSTTLFNFVLGPSMTKGRWGKIMVETIQDLKAIMGPNDYLLRHLWPHICEERGWFLDHDTNEEARKRFLDELQWTQLVTADGEIIANARWLSWPRGERERRPHWSTNLFILLVWAMTSGAVSRSWQVWRDRADLPVVDAAYAAKASSSSSEAPAAAVPVEEGKTSACPLQRAAEDLGDLYKRCRNQLHVCLELGADRSLRDDTRFVGLISNLWSARHGHDVQSMRTLDQ